MSKESELREKGNSKTSVVDKYYEGIAALHRSLMAMKRGMEANDDPGEAIPKARPKKKRVKSGIEKSKKKKRKEKKERKEKKGD